MSQRSEGQGSPCLNPTLAIPSGGAALRGKGEGGTNSTEDKMAHLQKTTITINYAEFICNPDRWPAWPLLPIKRNTSKADGPECCILFATEKPWEVVYDCNLFDLPTTIGEMKKRVKYKYDSVDSLLADGWIVD